MSAMTLDNDGGSVHETLPLKFQSIQDVLDISIERLKSASFVNVIGMVTDFQPPIQTRGTDWLCTFTMKDISTQYDVGIKVYIFWPPEHMPIFDGYQDVALIRNAKVQMHRGFISLMANHSTEFHQFRSVHQPSWPITLDTKYPESRTNKSGRSPSRDEKRYVIWLFHHIDKAELPTEEKFQGNTRSAMNFRDKFSLLKDVKDGQFYNIIGEIIRKHESNGCVTVYVTDYTPNTHFYNHAAVAVDEITSRDGDEYGYTKSKPKTDDTWPGPFGKMAIQLTLWEASAAYILENGDPGDWVLFENIRMKFPVNGGCLEGIQHSERNNPLRVRVSLIVQSEDPDANDARWKDALRRKRDYWRKFKKQKKEFDAEIAGHEEKRPADEVLSIPGKKRRRIENQEQFPATVRKVEPKLSGPPPNPNNHQVDPKLIKSTWCVRPNPAVGIYLKDKLNSNVRCFAPETIPFSFDQLFNKSVYTRRTNMGNIGFFPFINRNFKVAVRVVDYFPHNIFDFSRGRSHSEYDVLSDHSGDETTDISENENSSKLGSSSGKEKKWEWRFSLLLEDQTPYRHQRCQDWVLVDNHSAQMLFGMDATDLRQNKQAYCQLRKLLSNLWGNLDQLKRSAYEAYKSPHFERQLASISIKNPAYELPCLQQILGEPEDPDPNRTVEMYKKFRPGADSMSEVVKNPRPNRGIGDMPPTSSDGEEESMADRQKSLPISSGEVPSAPFDDLAAGQKLSDMQTQDSGTKKILQNLSSMRDNVDLDSLRISEAVSTTLQLGIDKLLNLPFECCLKEYGVDLKYLPENHFDCNYRRRLKLFGTKIVPKEDF